MSLDDLLAVWDHLPAGGDHCRSRDCGCVRFVCSCRGVRGCAARPAKRL